jgi:hypothetical protein
MTPQEAIRLLETAAVTEISLAFDGERRVSGFEVLHWITAAVGVRGLEPPQINVHTTNPPPPGHERIKRALEALERDDEVTDGNGA